jgi:hypothetical protein
MRTRLVSVGLFLLCSIAVNSEDKLYAPLPDKVVAAKTVFFVNDSGTARFGDDLYRQLKSWNRWEVVSDREKADLILVLSASDTAPLTVTVKAGTNTGQSTSETKMTSSGRMDTQHWHLYVIDARTGDNLWRSDASMGGKLWRSWGSIAKSLVSDIQKRLK